MSVDGVFDEVLLKLKAVAKTNRTVDAAQVQIVNLDEIIRRVGHHWPLVRDRIRAGSVDFLRGCVGPDDIIIPCGDGFLVVFAHGEAQDLKARCAEIQALLTAFYTGEEGLESLRARVEEMTLEQGALAQLMSSPPAPAKAAPSPAHGDHQIVFQPIWTAQAQFIACHFCTPTFCDMGVIRCGYDAHYARTGEHGAQSYAELDHAVLDAAADGVEGLLLRGGRGVVGFTVHAATMRHLRTRIAYLARLRALPAAVLERLVARIAEIEPNTPHSVLTEWVGQLRAHVRQVALQLHHTEPTFQRVVETGAWSIGAALPQHRRDADGAALKHLVDLVGGWGRAARGRHLKLCVEGARSEALLAAGASAGVDFFASDVFWPPRQAPADAAEAPAPHSEGIVIR
ncbi:MAG: hypothetical protein JNJ73_01545 [Hyphomonadaceae bacterium]|nr:hypothetical protein [Hyphomonadaceae bacterium]